MANQINQHIEMPQIQYTDKVADKSVAVQGQISPSTTETKAPEYSGAMVGKYQQNGDADKEVQSETIIKYCWSEGKNTVSIYIELDGLDDVSDDEAGKTNVSLAFASVAGKQQIFKLTGLAHETTGVKVTHKKIKQTFDPKIAKKEEKTWHKLLDDRQLATESSHIAPTREVVTDDTAKSNTDIPFRVSQTVISPRTWKNLLPQGTKMRLTIRHEAWILTRYNVRRNTGMIFTQTLIHCSFLIRS